MENENPLQSPFFPKRGFSLHCRRTVSKIMRDHHLQNHLVRSGSKAVTDPEPDVVRAPVIVHDSEHSSFKCCTRVHLTLYFAAIAFLLSSASIIRVFDQLTETFEFIFSPLPFENIYMLSDAAVDAILLQVVIIFIVTAIPSYIIGYPLVLRYHNKSYSE